MTKVYQEYFNTLRFNIERMEIMSNVAICPTCGKQARIPDGFTGKKVGCPSCKTRFLLSIPELPLLSPDTSPIRNFRALRLVCIAISIFLIGFTALVMWAVVTSRSESPESIFNRAEQQRLRDIKEVENRFGKDDRRVAALLTALGTFYQENDRDDEATEAIRRAVEIDYKINPKASQAQSMILLGQIYSKKGDYDEAELFFKRTLFLLHLGYEGRGVPVSDQAKRYHHFKIDALDGLAEAYRARGQEFRAKGYDDAAEFARQYR